MKALKIILMSICFVFIAMYLAFLFVLPNAVDLNSYAPQITKSIQDNTGFKVHIKGLKVKTSWNLSAGAQIDKTDLKYSSGEKFAQINGLQVKLSLLPLLFREVRVDRVEMDKLFLNLDIKKMQQEIAESQKKFKSGEKAALRFSPRMPDVTVKKYRISILDGINDYAAKGNDLKVYGFVLGEKVKVKTDGDLFLNKRKQISYKISLFSTALSDSKGQESQIVDNLKIFKDLYKYDVRANVNADLKIAEGIGGKVLLDGVSFALGGQTLPQSDVALNFNGEKIKINSHFYTDVNSKALITGEINHGKHKFIDLSVQSDKTDIKNTMLIAKTILNTFGVKTLDDIKADGFAKANFSLKSDFKKIQSSGYLKIKDANITNKVYGVSLKSVAADVDFSQDAIRIKQARANLDGQPIKISGVVDKNANANILISANNLQLKGVLLASGNSKILKENDIYSGIVNFKAALKGRLDKATPKISVVVSNIKLKNKKSKVQIRLSNAVVNLNNHQKNAKNSGRVELTNLKILSPSKALVSAPKLALVITDKNMKIEKTNLYINNIKTYLDGEIANILGEPRLSSVQITIPNQISVPIAGYTGSNVVIKGGLTLDGSLSNPQIKGAFNIPLVRIPSASLVARNVALYFDKNIRIICPQVQIANSSFNFKSQADINLSNGLIIRNTDFTAENIDLNTMIPVFKNLQQGSNQGITVVGGKSSIGHFKVGRIVSSNITSNIILKKNVLHLPNLRGEAYLGKVAGDVGYDFGHKKILINLQGREMSANNALTSLTGRNDDIHGQLSFDSNISMVGYSRGELLRSLKGNTNFIISNGKMGVLGKFEHLLYAQNILSNSVFKATLNVIAKAVTVKNTGVYKYLKGKVTFSDGWANIEWVKTSGPSMSLYITGRYYLPDNTANLVILGRISDDVVRILGPIGEFSMNKAISYIPKMGEITSFFASQFTTNPNYENTSMIPYLTPKTEFMTKEFKVVIDGEVQRQSSVKSFKWLARPKVLPQQENTAMVSPPKQAPIIPDFVKNLPDLKN